ncbi:unnamed protein product, partial [Symbiodinium sp. KB8]
EPEDIVNAFAALGAQNLLSSTDAEASASGSGEDRYKTPAMPSTFKFPTNISKYEVDWSAIEVEQYPVQDDMKMFVQALASSAKFKISGGVLLEHNPSWDRGVEATAETMRRYYYLVSSDLALKDPEMFPMNAHGVSQFGCNIFYALGHEAWGSLRKVYGGSFETARVATEEDQVLKDSNAKAYCVTRNRYSRYSFNYIAFETPDVVLMYAIVYVLSLSAQQLQPFLFSFIPIAFDISPTWTTPPPPPTETAPSLPPWPPAPPSRSTPPAAPADPRTTFKEDDEHYDANLVFKSTLRKTVEPSAWSRAKGLAGMDIRDVTVAHLSRRGLEEYGRRPLSHGRLTGIFLTRNVAETVLLSQIQKRLREDNIDVDATIEAIYKSKNLKPPDKVKEATNFVTPLVDEIFSAMKPWTQVKNYGKNPEQDNQVAQRMQELEEEAAKYKQRLKSAGMEVTPTKVLPLQPPPPSAPSDSQQTPSPSHQALRSGPPPDSAQEVPPTKRRRTQRGEKKKQYEKLIDEPYNVIKQSGQQPPTSMTSIKAWVTNLKKTMPADKHKEGQYTKVQLQEMATRWGVVPELYTFSRFEQPCAVYVKLEFAKLNRSGYPEVSKDTSFCYIGSTNLTVAKREYNRVAKLKQLKQLKLPKTEIAIRYWHDKQNYELFSTSLLSQHSEYIDELVKKAHGLVPVRQQPHLQKPPDTLAKQLFKKIRRRLQGERRHLVNALPKQAQFWKILYAISSDTKQEYDASRELRSGKHDNETVTLLCRLANHMEQPWRSKAGARLRRVLTFRNATVPKFNLPLKIPFLAHSAFKNNVQKWVSKLIRQHRQVLIPYHLPTKTIQELPHPALYKVLWNHMRKVTAQGRHWEPEPCKCHEFLLEHPRAEQHEGHVATGLETLDFCKDQSNLGAAFANVGACNAFFPSKQRLHDQVLDQLRRWLKHHLFPNDDRILESFEAFFEEQWQQHKEQQRHEPRLTHRLIKHLTSALPDNYIIHNEDHANAHLMIYCPNVYNQAAFNTWMDEKTFLLLDKTPEDIKEDMERQTPPVVRKHYKRPLDYNKPIPYGYIMMKRKKQWKKGRTIIAYSNTCVGRLLRVAALALQQMLKATWPHHFGNIAAPQLWQEVRELFQANEEQPERELIFLNHDLVGFFNSIPQADIIQSVRYLIAEFSKTNNDIRLIDPYSKLNPVHSGKSTHSIKSNMYVDNRAIIVDKDENCDDFLGFRINANNRQALDDLYLGKTTHDDVELTDVDSDSDIDPQPVRLPHGLPLDDPPPQLPMSSQLEIEQVCRRHLDNGYIPMSVFPWLAQKLPSELLRASALTRRGAPAMAFSAGAYYHAGSVGIRSNTRKYPCTSALLAYMVRACTHSNFSTVSLLHNVNMATHVERYNQPGSTNVLVPLSSFRRGELWLQEEHGPDLSPKDSIKDAIILFACQDVTNDEYNHKSMALADARSLACDMSIQRNVAEAPELIAYTILEVTFDLRTLVHLAQTNKATWIRCSQVLRTTSTECKIPTNAPWHKRAGRAVDGNALETPMDIKMYLFNKRMHTWYHHELSYQQYMDLQVRELLPAP